MKKVNRRKMNDSAAHNVFRSYSDMMSGLLLLFVLIMAVCLMQAQKNYTEKLAEQAKALQTQNELEASQSTVNEQQEQISEQEATLAEQASALEQLQAALEAQQLSLAEKESELDAQDALLTQQESELTASRADLAASQKKLNEANTLMEQQQERIDQIIGVKAELIDALNKEFQANQINVQIDKETGAILLDSSVLFSFNESELTEEGTEILDQVLPVYCHVLLTGEYADYVGEVIIDGYTDSTGDYVTNLSLSQSRAYAVAAYLLENMGSFLSGPEQTLLMSKLTANGKSSSNPILTVQGAEDEDASRRVEIKFRLKDEEMITELQALIEESQAAAANGGAAAETTPEAEADQEQENE